MPHPLDPDAVRRWCTAARTALEAARTEIDAINVFPVADGDTGTNLARTFAAAAAALPAQDGATASEAVRAMARGALLGACGNSGTILAQYLRGLALGLDAAQPQGDPGHLLAAALRRAADAAYEAVAHPVEGTMLTVASAAATAAEESRDQRPALVAGAACRGAAAALAATTEQLGALAAAEVVDAGGTGLLAVLGALRQALGGAPLPETPPNSGPAQPGSSPDADVPAGAPAYEVMYLLETGAEEVAALRARLDPLGDSLVVGGGDGLWSVHVHVHDAGAAVEAALDAGRPRRIRIAHLGAGCGAPDTAPGARRHEGTERGPAPRAVVAVVPGEGLAGLCTEAGAAVVPAAEADEPALLDALRATGAGQAVLLPNDTELHTVAARAAAAAREAGIRTAVIPTRAAVQGLAALAVHASELRFDEDVVAMTSAAGATRYGEVAVAAHRSWTTAGVCQAGDVLGLVEGDVALIGGGIAEVADEVVDRMLAAGGELVTLVTGSEAPAGLGERLRGRVRTRHLGVDTVVYEGRQHTSPLLVGVE
ncbi:DAK2 domain-containing protein [Streptomyces sulphureus]|uniref:DAK2 domain-containing protein n=1 Tax=Streptomyces sulphureus TaxID=47758 RepID=UPI0003637F78|nr:DAK2 domain-containing protein [Streptomyces sulphureus]